MSEPNLPASADSAPGAVRFKIVYKTAEALLGEFNRSVSQGRVAIESRRNLPLGTRFILELRTVGMAEVVEVVGEVVEVVELNSDGQYLLGIQYDAGSDRTGVEAVLSRIFAAQIHEKMRRYPRIPINLRANEALTDSPPFTIRDLSRGGVGVVMDLPGLPSDIVVGAPFLLQVRIADWELDVRGEVAWAMAPPSDRALWFSPAFGVSFFAFDFTTGAKLDQLLTHTDLPKAPWRARIHVGPDAERKPRR